MLCRRNYHGVLFVMKMQLSCALIVIMISTAKAAFPKVMMNGNSSITGMCLSHQKKWNCNLKAVLSVWSFAYLRYIITYVYNNYIWIEVLTSNWTLGRGRGGHQKSFVNVFIIVFCLIVMLFTICDIPENIVARSFQYF